MALDPSIVDAVKEIGYWIGASLLGAGGAVGGTKVMEKRRRGKDGEERRRGNDGEEQASFCQEHHKCFQEIKDAIGGVKNDVSYIRGVIDRGMK